MDDKSVGSMEQSVELEKYQGEVLACFQYPLIPSPDDETRTVVCIYDAAPFITIEGDPGTGKSVRALALAKQALAQDLDVHYCGHKMPPIDSPDLEHDIASQATYQLLNDGRFHFHAIFGGTPPIFGNLPKPPRGGVLIVDEINYVANVPAAITDKDWPLSFKGIVIICGSPPEMPSFPRSIGQSSLVGNDMYLGIRCGPIRLKPETEGRCSKTPQWPD